VVVIRSVFMEPIMRIDIVCGVRMWGRMYGRCGDGGVSLTRAWAIIHFS